MFVDYYSPCMTHLWYSWETSSICPHWRFSLASSNEDTHFLNTLRLFSVLALTPAHEDAETKERLSWEGDAIFKFGGKSKPIVKGVAVWVRG